MKNLTKTGAKINSNLETAQQGAHKRRVLVVEDETDARELFCSIVEKCGFTVLEAADGEKAMNMISIWQKLDAIILDIKLPKIHGFEIIENLRKMGKKIPLIICTAYSGLLDDMTVASYPNVITMMKPVSLKTLEINLKNVVFS